VSLDDRVGGQRGGDGDQLDVLKLRPLQTSDGGNSFGDADGQVVERGQGLGLAPHLAAGRIEQHGVGVGSTGVYAQREFQSISRLSSTQYPGIN
jgi:hypothetical protein